MSDSKKIKIYVSTEIKVGWDEIKEAVNYEQAKKLLKEYSYHENYKEDLLDMLGYDSSDHIEEVSNSRMESHIKENLDYYECTKSLKNELREAEEANDFENLVYERFGIEVNTQYQMTKIENFIKELKTKGYE